MEGTEEKPTPRSREKLKSNQSLSLIPLIWLVTVSSPDLGRGFQRLLFRRREQHVVQDQSVARRVLVQRQVGGRRPDDVLRVLRIVAAIVRPRPLPIVAVDVLHPR